MAYVSKPTNLQQFYHFNDIDDDVEHSDFLVQREKNHDIFKNVGKFEDMTKTNGVSMHNQMSYCKAHISETLKYYCNTCDTPICTECIISLHQQPIHSFERLADAEAKNLNELQILINEAKDKIDYCQSQYMKLENYLADLQEQNENTRGYIEETYQSYRALIEKRRDEMLKELNERHAKEELAVMDMHNSIDTCINQITDTVRFTELTLKNGNSFEILLLKRHIINQIRNVFKSLPHATINTSLKFQTDQIRFEKALKETFGSIVAGSQHVINEDSLLGQQPLADEWTMLVNKQANGISADHSSGTTSPNAQDWFMGPSTKQQQQHNQAQHIGQQLVHFNDQQIHSPQSSPTSTTPDWLVMNMVNMSHVNGHKQQINGMLNMSNNNSNSSTSGSNSGQRTSPIENALQGLINGNHHHHHVNSRSQTPGSIVPTASTNLDDLLQFSTNCSLKQNITQISQLIGTTQGANSLAGTLSIQSVSPPLGGSIDPSDQAFAGNGNLNPPVRNGKMTHMQIRCKFGQLGPAKGQFNSPHGFCLGSEEEIIIADTNNHRIQIFDKTGEFKYQFGIPGREEGQLWYPRKVTVMRASGKFVVCDRGNERSRMQIFNKNGHFIKKIAIRYIDIVAGLAITNEGHIVAVDSVSPTVFRISEAGDLLKWFDCSDYMREPSDIAINGKDYYVCDFKGHCVVVFNEEGDFVRRIGGENITNFPNGIDVSDAGDVLVGDSHGNRFHVAVFSREGAIISEFECPYVKVSRCCGLKITSEGYVVTLAKNNHHVLILNTLYVS